MSIALIIEEINQKQVNEYVPVSTQESFLSIWKPICEKEDFKWILLFETGSTFTEKDIPYIIKELNDFKNIYKKYIQPDSENIISRLDLLMSNLESLKGKNVIFSIG